MRQPHGWNSPLWTDAAPAREHIIELGRRGIGQAKVITLSGVNAMSLRHLMRGSHGHPPAKRMLMANYVRIMSVTAELDNVPGRGLVDSTITIRKLQALCAMGWTYSALGALLSTTDRNIGRTFTQATVTGQRAREIRDLFNQLWDQRPPITSLGHYLRNLRYYEARGYVTALAWDDIEDITEHQPSPYPLYKREGTRNGVGVARVEIAFLRSCGESDYQISKRVGVQV